MPKLSVHRLIAGSQGIVIIEASSGAINNTARVEDKYGRKVHRDFDWVSYEKILRGGK